MPFSGCIICSGGICQVKLGKDTESVGELSWNCEFRVRKNLLLVSTETVLYN
jgi:hypothetical protein